MFTITADGHIKIDSLTLQPDTSAQAFQDDIAALPSTDTPRPTVKWVKRGSTSAQPRRSDRPSTMFKIVKKLEVSFPVIDFAMGDKARKLDNGTLYFIADRPDIMHFQLVKADADYPQVNSTQISVREHDLLNEWARTIFGPPNQTQAIDAYGVENLIFELKWGRVSTEFQTAGERPNEPGWSVLEIRFDNPSPDSTIKALDRWDNYASGMPQSSRRPLWKRLFGGALILGVI